MTNFQKRIVTAIATGAVLLSTLTPAFASEIRISGNGSHSNNDVDVNLDNNVDVNQSNYANIDNNIDVDASTGNNDANDNTNGDVNIDTGNANVNVDVQNIANKNVASVDNCCQGNFNIDIAGNGTDSDNNVDLNVDNDVDLDQDNYADFDNDIDADARTGGNDANDNTGGSVRIDTGNANVDASVMNTANYNSARIGGGEGNGGLVSARILGNGSHSDNNIDLDFDNNVDVNQDNYADFDNDLWLDATTGYNDANDNTGGDVEIDTGDADVNVEVDNLANFNWADLDGCGCVEDLKAVIEGNGTDSDSEIVFDSDNDLDLDQDNDSHFDTDVDVDSDTGKNDANDNTGEVEGDSDPSVDTGNANADVDVNSTGNVNLYGADAEGDLPDVLDDLNVTFDLGDLLEWLSSHLS